jgi:phosphoesterase RecJ-like protein
LYRLLRKSGKSAVILNPDHVPENLAWLAEADDIQVFDGGLKHRRLVAEADAVVVLDTNAANRLDALGPAIKISGATKILVDHHPDAEGWFDVCYARESASSTGELVYELMRELESDGLDEIVAEALYVAIATDTGSFRFGNVSPEVHEIIGHLMRAGGLRADRIYENVYERKSADAMRFLGAALGSIRLCHNSAVGYLTVSREMMERFDVDRGDTDGLANQVLSIDGVRVAMSFLETAVGTKISFRSKGSAHVDKLAQALGGGGHKNASGAFLREPLSAAVRRAVDAVPRHVDLESVSREPDGISSDDQAYLESLIESKGRDV